MKKIVILTGAGMSVESGLSTFRDAGGLWDKYPVEDVATPEGYARNPLLVTKFYNERRKNQIPYGYTVEVRNQFSSVAQLCLTLCDPMDHSMPGLPVHHQLPEFTQTHVH